MKRRSDNEKLWTTRYFARNIIEDYYRVLLTDHWDNPSREKADDVLLQEHLDLMKAALLECDNKGIRLCDLTSLAQAVNYYFVEGDLECIIGMALELTKDYMQ